MKDTYIVVFTGSFQYPEGYAGTKRIQHLINYLNKTGHCTLVLLFNNNCKSGYFNGTLYKSIYKFKNDLFNILLFLPQLLNGVWFLKKKHFEKHSILYVYSGITLENFLLVVAARIIGYKILVDFVEDFSLHQEKVSVTRNLKIKSMVYFENRIYKFANGIIVISDYLFDKFRDKVSNDYPIYKLPINAELNEFPTKKNTNRKILYSGTYGVKDGFNYLYESFIKLKQDYDNIEMWLTGKLNKETKEKIGSNKYIFATDYLSDPEYHKILKEADILVMPRINSHYANASFPFKLGEYLATGNPVVCTNVSDISKYLTNKVNAVIVEPENVESLYEGIMFLLENQEIATQIGFEGRKICKQYFNPVNNGKKLVSIMETLV